MIAVDVILLLVTLCFTVEGYRRGVLSSLCTLLILVISVFGAFIAARTLSYRVSESIEPAIEKVLEENLSAVLAENGHTENETSLTIGGVRYSMESLIDYLNSMGVDASESAEELSDAADQAITQYAQEAAVQIADTIAPVMVFLAAFLILYLILHTVQLIFEQGSSGTPIRTLNRAAGAAVGFLTAAVLLTSITTMLQGMGLLDELETSGIVFGLLRKTAGLIV